MTAQLVSRDVSEAPSLAEVLPEIDRRVREGVLLVHHASIDVAFLKREFARLGIAWPSPRIVDTMRLLLRNAQLRDPRRRATSWR